MSFSADVKTELSKITNLKNKDEVYAELLGYLATANISSVGKNVKFATENEYNINRFSKLLNNVEINNYKIDVQGKNYIITFKSNQIIAKLNINILSAVEVNIKKSFIRGSFLGGGSINNPRNKYHLEITYSNINNAKIGVKILEDFNIKSKILESTQTSNKHNVILYIKDSEEISKLLALMGANLAVIKFEEIRVIRDMKNNVNRVVNCETANLNKTITASVEQISNIKKLRKTGKFNKMPDELKEIAILREKEPNATLQELGKMLNKPIGKSSVSNRFKKIKEYL